MISSLYELKVNDPLSNDFCHLLGSLRGAERVICAYKHRNRYLIDGSYVDQLSHLLSLQVIWGILLKAAHEGILHVVNLSLNRSWPTVRWGTEFCDFAALLS